VRHLVRDPMRQPAARTNGDAAGPRYFAADVNILDRKERERQHAVIQRLARLLLRVLDLHRIDVADLPRGLPAFASASSILQTRLNLAISVKQFSPRYAQVRVMVPPKDWHRIRPERRTTRPYLRDGQMTKRGRQGAARHFGWRMHRGDREPAPARLHRATGHVLGNETLAFRIGSRIECEGSSGAGAPSGAVTRLGAMDVGR
jgi:hypothetical protein